MKVVSVTIFLSLVSLCSASSFCPYHCECLTRSAKLTAECQDAGISTVPHGFYSALMVKYNMLVILNNLKHCQVVDLSGNNLILDSQDIFIKSGLNMLQNTILSNCSITTLHPRTFAGLHSLNHLDLSNNLLVQFPAHIFQFIPQIGSLTLAGNSLETCPGVLMGVLF